MASEENLKAIIRDLESQLKQREEEITKVRAEMSEQIQRLKSELHAMQILHNAKEEQKRSNRRTKQRVYLP
jgi:Skp family chaperone for outer membrane proteins